MTTEDILNELDGIVADATFMSCIGCKHAQKRLLPGRALGMARLAGNAGGGRKGMSYNIAFKVKVDGIDAYVPVGSCGANITWNVRKIIEESTGLEWENCQNNGLCVDVIPKIEAGLKELEQNPAKYRAYEATNGWGTVEGTIQFFRSVLNDWNDFRQWYEELVPVVTFWIE